LVDPSSNTAAVDLVITHTPFSGDSFTLMLPDKSTEEFDTEELRKWLKEHGAVNIDAVDRAIDHAWNFGRVTISIRNFVVPPSAVHSGPLDPKV